MTLLILHVNQGEWDRSTPNHEGGGGHISFPAGPQPGTSLAVWWGRIFMGVGARPKGYCLHMSETERVRGGGKVSGGG